MGRIGLISLLTAMLAAGAAAPPPAGTIAQVLAALDQGDAQQAESLSDAGLRQETMDASDRARLLLYHGLANALLGAHDAAIRDLAMAIHSHALPPEEEGQAYLQRGFLCEGLGRLDEAVADYGAVIALKSYSTATAFNNRGNIYLRRGLLVDARQDYLQALSADGGQSQYSYYGLGRVAEMEGDRLAARAFYTKAVAVDADYAAASRRLAVLGGPAKLDSVQNIVLRPPPDRSAGTSHAGPAGPVVLHPPSDAQDTHGDQLPAVPPQSPFAPASGPTLRPALDQSHSRVSAGSSGQVQLGAWRNAAQAYAAWDEAKVRAGGLLDGVSPLVLAAAVPGKGRYFRLRVHSGAGETGTDMCARLAAKAIDCFPVRD